MKIGEVKRLQYHEETAQRLANGAINGSAAMQIFILKNLGRSVRWTDKTETEVTANVNADVNLIPKFGE